MEYPTMQEVHDADHEQLGRWYRFLPSPAPDQVRVMDYICERFKNKGGFTPELSKKIGWGKP